MTWNEHLHGRHVDGRFAEMAGSAPESSLTPFEPDATFQPVAGDMGDRAGERVETRYIEDDESDEFARMFEIRFADGVTGLAYEEEIEHDEDDETAGDHLPGTDRPATAAERFELAVRDLAAKEHVDDRDLERARDLGTLIGYTRASVTERIDTIRRGDADLYEHLPYGPSTITRGASIGYHAGPSRLTRAHVAPEDRDEAAAALATWSLPGTAAADPAHWHDLFDAYDAIDEYELPTTASERQVAGVRSVSREALNLDLDHQPLSYTIRILDNNEQLARRPGPHNTSPDPQRQTALDELWTARADRLRDVRERLEQIDVRARTRRAHGA